MATYTLNITFTGLCLFVPEPVGIDPKVGTMTVLMPKLGPQHHHGMDRHVPVLGFDVAHASSDGITGTHAYTLIRDFQLVHPGTAADLTLCPEIVNLAEVTRRPVDPDHLGSDTSKKLVSRVRLGAGKISAVAPGACWEWAPGQIRSISHMVRWTIEGMTEPELKLRLPGLHTGSLLEIPTLRPLAGEINLFVHHVPQGDLLPDPETHHDPLPGAEPPHFAPFYRLFGDDPPMRLPRFKSMTCPPPANPCPRISETGPSTFTCMVAAATMG